MILTGDYHTHTPYSHGKNSVDENVARAKEIGLKQVGISDHGYSHVVYGLKRHLTDNYVRDCKQAAEKYGIDVLVGLESNICGIGGGADLKPCDYDNFDLYLCGNHVFIYYDTLQDHMKYFWGNMIARRFFKKTPQGLVDYNTKAYINVIKNNPIDAITHLNYLCPCKTLEVAKCAADYGTYIELNSKKTHLSDEDLMEIAEKTSARFIVNSDAHWAGRIGDTERVEEQLTRISFPMDRIDNIDGRFPNLRFADFKKHR